MKTGGLNTKELYISSRCRRATRRAWAIGLESKQVGISKEEKHGHRHR